MSARPDRLGPLDAPVHDYDPRDRPTLAAKGVEMTESLASPQVASSALGRPWRSGPFSMFFAFTPLWIRIYAHFAWTTFSSPMFAPPAGPFGIPLATLVEGLVMLWMLIGVYVLWSTRSRVVAAAVYLVFTIPATIALVFGPAIVLILQNQG